MSVGSNIDVVRSAYESFGSGNIPGLLETMSDDIKWTVPDIENASFSGPRQGKDALTEFFKLLAEEEDITRFEPLEFIAQDEKVVVIGETAATVRATGNSYETDWVHVMHLRDGRIAEFQEFFDTAAATRAFQKAATAS
ncbi:MAG: nuclear transport factor 2 family protein [Acidobacteriota bacterium]